MIAQALKPVPPRGCLTTLLLAIAPLAVCALAAILFRYPPSQYGFYPQCPIHHYLHLDCPGCGTTRAIAELLHGHLLTALRLNALTTLLLPFVIVYAGAAYLRLLRGQPIRLPQLSPGTMQVVFAVTIVFTIVRNF